MPDVYLKQNDTAPTLSITLKDGAGDVVDISGATAVINWILPSGTEYNRTGTITTGTDGVVTYDPVADDTAEAGHVRFEIQITFSGGAIETWPNGNQSYIAEISPELS